jgi:TPR repeat protein
MSAAEIDQARAHRWFAVEFNNTAWSLLESGDRSPAVLDRALACAYAAWLHWEAVGTAVNRQRAMNLLAQACTAGGRQHEAIRYGREGLALSQTNGEEQTPFDRAAALAALAAASRFSLDWREADSLEDQALALAADLPDDDRRVIDFMLALRAVAL